MSKEAAYTRSVRSQFEQIKAKAEDDRRFETMSMEELGRHAFEHDLEGFKARHHLWQRLAQSHAKN